MTRTYATPFCVVSQPKTIAQQDNSRKDYPLYNMALFFTIFPVKRNAVNSNKFVHLFRCATSSSGRIKKKSVQRGTAYYTKEEARVSFE